MVIGAGAAGLMAAIFAAEGPAPVQVLESTTDGGRKILISGGGRCNILPAALHPERFVTDSPAHVLRGMLRAWPVNEQRRYFEDTVGLPLALETSTGKWFPASSRARDVRDGLVALARRRGVTFRFESAVTSVVPAGEGWTVEARGGALRASRVVLATGGLSVPTTGSDGAGLRMAATLGHRLHATYPALTPLTSSSPPPLAGVSLPVRIRARGREWAAEATGGFLFTHRGYSGPAVLDVSHVCVRATLDDDAGGAPREGDGAWPATVRVSWSPATSATDWDARLRAGDRLVSSVVSAELPERLALFLVDAAGVPRDRRTSSLRRAERTALVEALTSFALPWAGHEGYRKAEVTGGGVALDEVDPRTLESRRHPGLHLCGEVLDAFGPIGGYNFAWAWATGRAAGRAAGRLTPG